MIRKPIIKATLAACLTGAVLAATATDAGLRPRPNSGHYDCSQNYEYMHKSRYFNAHMMRIFTVFDAYATGIVEDAIRDLEANAGADPATLHTIASTAEHYLGYKANYAKEYLHDFRNCALSEYFPKCRRLFGRNIAFNHSMCKRVRDRQVELRDQLNAALASAVAGGTGD